MSSWGAWWGAWLAPGQNHRYQGASPESSRGRRGRSRPWTASACAPPPRHPAPRGPRRGDGASPSKGEDGSPPPGAGWARRCPMTTASGDQSPRSWNDAAAVAAIRDFVARGTAEGSPEFLPAAERVAVFDNDGTLWCEKPMPIELGFILQRLAATAERDASLPG